MRSYINKQGDRITVSKEHLDSAVKIKTELQKASPSRRASWSQLAKLMEKEGFDDAENSETYRLMIKNYQKSVGKLPDGVKYAEMVQDGKIESIKDLVGELAFEKRENQLYLREINKGKNKLIDFSLIAKSIEEKASNHDFFKYKITQKNNPRTETPSTIQTGNKMLVFLSDLHIGALIDNVLNKYNFDIALERLSKYATAVRDEADIYGVNELYIMNLGDVIEHASMRFNQGYSAEYSFSEQVVIASDLIIKFISYLIENGFKIKYSGIAGNHDRIVDKDKNIDGDHAVKIINAFIRVFAKKQENFQFIEANDYDHAIEMNGRNLKFVHGDLDSIKNEKLLAEHASMDGVDYDAIVMGHYHHHRVVEVGSDKYIISFGCLKGADDYGVKIRKLSSISQGLIVVTANGEIIPKKVKLADYIKI